jgi:hypothetical protein
MNSFSNLSDAHFDKLFEIAQDTFIIPMHKDQYAKSWSNFLSTMESNPYLEPDQYNDEIKQKLKNYGAKLLNEMHGTQGIFLKFFDMQLASYFMVWFSTHANKPPSIKK